MAGRAARGQRAAPVRSRRRAPSWAVVCVVFGALLMLVSGGMIVAVEWAIARYGGAIDERNLFGQLNPPPEPGEDITGPLNILLAGLDTRPSRPNEPPRADVVMIVHINQNLDHGYLISLPRDTLVDIPPYPDIGYPGGRDRLNAAMFHGARQVNGEDSPNIARGFELLARTVTDLTGVGPFDAGAVLNFSGFTDVVDAMGGVTVTLDERIVSRHRQPDGSHRPLAPGGNGYLGPQMVYEPGVHQLEGWQALDIVRQRYGVEGGDYGRQANQQLILRAMMEQALSREMVTDPAALDKLIRAAGEALTFDGRGNDVIDYAFALSGLRPGAMTMIGLPATGVVGNGDYQGERLDPAAYDLFGAIRRGEVGQFVLRHPDFRN